MASFVEPWEWNPGMMCWQRFVVETNGSVHIEYLQDVDDVFAMVREQERQRHNELGMECVASVPTTVMDDLYRKGVPVFDPDVGDEALLEAIRKDYPYLRTAADKGA